VTTTKPKAAAAARIGAALAARKRGELLALLSSCFVRVEPWLQAGKYVSALVSDLPKRNGWAIAQLVGGPDAAADPAAAEPRGLGYLRRDGGGAAVRGGGPG
jgi:hypothetical protein